MKVSATVREGEIGLDIVVQSITGKAHSAMTQLEHTAVTDAVRTKLREAVQDYVKELNSHGE